MSGYGFKYYKDIFYSTLTLENAVELNDWPKICSFYTKYYELKVIMIVIALFTEAARWYEKKQFEKAKVKDVDGKK